MPTLILQDGQVLYDSRVICEYLASQADAQTIFPASGGDRWTALTRQALGDGLLDAGAAGALRADRASPEFQWPTWREALLTKVRACLEAIEAIASGLSPDKPTIGEITIGCALGYLDFRFPELDWRAMRQRRPLERSLPAPARHAGHPTLRSLKTHDRHPRLLPSPSGS